MCCRLNKDKKLWLCGILSFKKNSELVKIFITLLKLKKVIKFVMLFNILTRFNFIALILNFTQMIRR